MIANNESLSVEFMFMQRCSLSSLIARKFKILAISEMFNMKFYSHSSGNDFLLIFNKKSISLFISSHAVGERNIGRERERHDVRN